MAKANHITLRKTGKDIGVIVLAHGATEQWNSEVERACCARLAEVYPTVVVFGMAPAEKTQQAIHALEAIGVRRVIVVPFLISSHSELFRQTEFMLGLRDEADPDYVTAMHRVMEHPFSFIREKISWISWRDLPYTVQMVMDHRNMRHDLQVESRIPLTLLQPLDSSQLVGAVLEERAGEMSKNPAEENVVIVAHGPLIDKDNVEWLHEMEKLAESVRQRGFHSVSVATIRDDAKDDIKNAAISELRERVKQGAEGGRKVIVVPLLISRGGIERELRLILSGLKYSYNEKTLLPHANIERWLIESVEKEAARNVSLEPVKKVNRQTTPITPSHHH